MIQNNLGKTELPTGREVEESVWILSFPEKEKSGSASPLIVRTPCASAEESGGGGWHLLTASRWRDIRAEAGGVAALTLAPRKCITSSAGALWFDFHAATVGWNQASPCFAGPRLQANTIQGSGCKQAGRHQCGAARCTRSPVSLWITGTCRWKVGGRLSHCNLWYYYSEISLILTPCSTFWALTLSTDPCDLCEVGYVQYYK